MTWTLGCSRRLRVLTVLVGTAAAALVLPAEVLSVGSTEDYIHFRLGTKYKSEKKFDLAIEEFRKVLAAYPDNFNAYMQLAEIREEQGRYGLAIHNLGKALAHNPGWGKAQKMLARMYELDGQYYKAMDELQDYLQISDPEERDSIQGAIDRLVGVIHGANRPGAGGANATTTDTEALPASKEPSPASTAGRTLASSGKNPTPSSSSPAAEKEFQQGVVLYKQAVDEGEEKKFEDAMVHLRKALALQPGHSGSYYYAGLIRRRQGQNEMARINFERALSYPELGYNAHFYLGKIHGERKSYAPAVEHLRAYLAKTDYEPGKREARNLIEAYESAMRAETVKTPRIDVAEIGRQEMRQEVGKIPPEPVPAPIELRIDSLLYMVVADTLSKPGRAMLKGVVAFRDQKYDEAVETFKEVMVDYPKGSVAAQCVYNIGVCYMKLRNYEGAENQFSQILARFPSHSLASPSRFLQALSYYERHEPARAEKLFRDFIRLHRDHEWVGAAYERLGDAYVELEQHRQAIDAYQQAAAHARSPLDKVHALYKQAETYGVIDNTRRAVDLYKEVIATGEAQQVYERVPDSYYRIADYHYRTKNFGEALNYYRDVTKKYPGYHDNAWGLFQIGNVHKNLGDFEKAIDAYKVLMEIHDGEYWAQQAQWKLEDAVWEHQYRSVLR